MAHDDFQFSADFHHDPYHEDYRKTADFHPHQDPTAKPLIFIHIRILPQNR